MKKKWINRWMDMAIFISKWSEDKSRKIGAVIVDDTQRVISLGWNGVPRGVDGSIAERHIKPTKNLYFEHAERNCIYNAAANGSGVKGCSIFVTLMPCAECARAIVQSGIKALYCIEPNWNDKSYCESFKGSVCMFNEVGLNVVFVDGYHYSVCSTDNE